MQISSTRWLAGRHIWLYCLLAVGLLTSCGRPHVPAPSPALPPALPDTTPGPDRRVEYGTATWYGRERQGRRTASGEIFDSARLTAAHRTAPFGTYARVTNLANGRVVQVRINDRGPAAGKHMLDLSYAAAQQLGMVQAGIARVKVEFVYPSRLPPSS